jgi:hypothetical protein
MNSESNSKSRLKTTKGKFIVRFNGLELLALIAKRGVSHTSVQGGLCSERNSPGFLIATPYPNLLVKTMDLCPHFLKLP